MSETINPDAPKQSHLLAGFMTGEQLEAETGWGWRTRLRREVEGLPFVKIGHTKLYPIDKARAWLMSQIREPNAPRRPGRPRKQAA